MHCAVAWSVRRRGRDAGGAGGQKAHKTSSGVGRRGGARERLREKRDLYCGLYAGDAGEEK